MGKRCTRCHQWKERSEFYQDKSKLDGLKSHCKPCHEAYKKSYRDTPAARLLEVKRMYWKRTLILNPLLHRTDEEAAFQGWLAKNRARRRARVREILKKYFTQHKKEAGRWKRDNREMTRTSNQQARARNYETAINTLTSIEWQWILEKYDFCCAYCGKRGEGLTPDHIEPLSRGGANYLSNIVPACGPCNLHKGARTPEEAGMAFAIHIDSISGFEQLALI
jgi:5-methylcytosine-specific restriction endonuclease McrA